MNDALSDIPGTGGVQVSSSPGHPSAKTLMLAASLLFLIVAAIIGGIFVFQQQNLIPKAQVTDVSSCQAQGGVVRDACQGREVPIGVIGSGAVNIGGSGTVGGGDSAGGSIDVGRQTQLCCKITVNPLPSVSTLTATPMPEIPIPTGGAPADPIPSAGTPTLTFVPEFPTPTGVKVDSSPTPPFDDTSTQCPDPNQSIAVTVSCISCRQ